MPGSTDGHRAGEEQVCELQGLKLRVIYAAQGSGAGAQQGQRHHGGDAQQGEPSMARISQRRPLRRGNERNGADRQPQKEGAHKIDIFCEQAGQQDDAGRHAHAPSKPELQKVDQRGPSFRAASSKQAVERVQKPFIKAQNKGDRSAGDAGNAVGQGHAEAVKCG